VSDPDKRPTSLDDIRIQDVVINRAKALPSGDYGLWSDYGLMYRGETSRRSSVVTVTRQRGEWRVLAIRMPLP